MKYVRIGLAIYFLLLYTNRTIAQNDFSNSNSDITYGVSTKVNIEFSNVSGPAFKFSLTGGIGYDIENVFLPTVHTGILLFNSNSVGADQSKKWYNMQAHFFINTTATARLDKRDFGYFERNVPLYHFADFTANPLQNPYKTSVSYGLNWIFVQDKKQQRTGFFNLNVMGRAQISYYNDGGPILGWAGDNRDRYYTGGVTISYHGDITDLIDLVELSYHKYTGYQKHAFDVADHLQIDFLNYQDTKQFAFNQQRWRLNFSNLENGFGGSVSIYNKGNLDLQDFLHFNTNVPYHPDYYQGYRWMIGARYEYNHTKF
ncbi:hypothetical protein IMCC3317_44500 [Kordia antarctica]|uniref:Bacterial toxin 23 domain-containing protein n=1 Tax=Kordia antarctica TaxID=1218801 RepID=A0A7L4ZRE4_9FLAO|nr:polymorphic toxin type 23 domain-containing protein [Kordia antarctica]QHI39049.1 hypothetical protein IMCC3317_44500 [Kordia antarctica]